MLTLDNLPGALAVIFATMLLPAVGIGLTLWRMGANPDDASSES